MSRIVQVANFVAPTSGGIRTVLANLADGYARNGHETVQIVPGRHTNRQDTQWGERITLKGLPLPKTGYRVLSARDVRTSLDALAPDRLEVHDRSTLRSLGRWARENGIRSCAISHERLDRLLTYWTHTPRLSRSISRRFNSALAAEFDTIVCTTSWAAEEFAVLDVADLRVVPLGVDTDTFAPLRASVALRAQLACPGESVLVLVSRLSPEKRPGLAVDAVAELVARGERVRLVVAGDGPLRARLQARARRQRLPVSFLGHLSGAAKVAALQASADVAIAPGPVETFGLAAIEALACGTPIVVNAASALPEVGGVAGFAAEPTSTAFADAVQRLLAAPRSQRRDAARVRARHYSWQRTVEGFLAVHDLTARERRAG